MRKRVEYQRHTLLGEPIISAGSAPRAIAKKNPQTRLLSSPTKEKDAPTVIDCETGEVLKLTTAKWSSKEGRLTLGSLRLESLLCNV